MAEKAQDADIAMGNGMIAVNMRGQWLGAAVSILALILAAALGAYRLYSDAPGPFCILPAALVGVPVFAVVKAIVQGLHDRREEAS